MKIHIRNHFWYASLHEQFLWIFCRRRVVDEERRKGWYRVVCPYRWPLSSTCFQDVIQNIVWPKRQWTCDWGGVPESMEECRRLWLGDVCVRMAAEDNMQALSPKDNKTPAAVAVGHKAGYIRYISTGDWLAGWLYRQEGLGDILSCLRQAYAPAKDRFYLVWAGGDDQVRCA